MENPKIKIIMEDGKEISLELFPEVAPITVKNFLKLVDEKFYDGICFHRVIENFMIQAGGYYIKENTLYEKDKAETIYGEFKSNGFNNPLKHQLGVISMARLGHDKNSASSQFFICSATSPHLDTDYSAFGKTINQESNDVVISISKAPKTFIHDSLQDFPYPVIKIKTIERIN